MMTDAKDLRTAKQLYARWFAKYPTAKNPTDVNTRAKYDFAVAIGWEKLSLMLRARKANTEKNGYPFPWTKPDYWLGVFDDV
jgi:hypothetical protein